MKNKTITTKQLKLMASTIVDILNKKKPSCSYRKLIYDYMGLDKSYYAELYPEVQELTNTLAEVSESDK